MGEGRSVVASSEDLGLLEDMIGAGGLRLVTYEWRPADAGRPRAAVVLAHGYGEHADRHRRPISALVSRGYLVAALDHRAHGRSDGLPRATCSRFDDYTDDYASLVSRTKGRYPDAPLFALGHSMGALIALRYALRCEHELAGLIVAGVALHPIPAVSGPARPLIKALVRQIARVAPGLPVTPPRESRCHPAADELCYAGPTPALMAAELLAAGDDAARRAAALTYPLLVLHGTRDRVTCPEGAVELHERASSRDKTLALFEDLRHPTLTPTRSPALATLLRWLEERCDPHQPASPSEEAEPARSGAA